MKLKIPWDKFRKWFGIIGVPLAIIFWLTDKYYFVDKPEITFTMLSNESVFSVSDTVKGLNINYAEVNFLEENLNLSVLVVRIQNTGTETIEINSYDSNSPLAFDINKGRLVPLPEIVNSSDIEYFSNVLVSDIDQEGYINPIGTIRGRVLFKPKILNKGDFFDVKCLVIHNPEDSPQIIPQGKIAGVSRMVLSEYQSTDGATIHDKSLVLTLSFSMMVMAIVFLIHIFISRQTINSLRMKNTESEDYHREVSHRFKNNLHAISLMFELYRNSHKDGEDKIILELLIDTMKDLDINNSAKFNNDYLEKMIKEKS